MFIGSCISPPVQGAWSLLLLAVAGQNYPTSPIQYRVTPRLITKNPSTSLAEAHDTMDRLKTVDFDVNKVTR